MALAAAAQLAHPACCAPLSHHGIVVLRVASRRRKYYV
jgi:hypothetical protein